MEIDSAPVSRCSKEHQKIYQEWFSFADSGCLYCFSYFKYDFKVDYLITDYELGNLMVIFFMELDGDGRLTGGDATKFFSMSNLPRQDLKQVTFFFQLVQLFSLLPFLVILSLLVSKYHSYDFNLGGGGLKCSLGFGLWWS